jgi:hypothetical protein
MTGEGKGGHKRKLVALYYFTEHVIMRLLEYLTPGLRGGGDVGFESTLHQRITGVQEARESATFSVRKSRILCELTFNDSSSEKSSASSLSK